MASTTKQTKLDFKVLRLRAKIKSEGEADTKPEPLPKTKIKTAHCPFLTDDEAEAELELLKQFDLNIKYGPCLGMTRLERWERAKKFGLDPPAKVLALLRCNHGNQMYTQCLWFGENGLVP